MPLSSTVLKLDSAIFVPIVALAILGLFIFLISNLKSSSTSNRISTIPTVIPTITPITLTPTPFPQAKSFITTPLLYSQLTWKKVNSSTSPQFAHPHSSFQAWQSQLSGQSSLYEYFDNKIFGFYKKKLEPLGWQSEYTADGPSGAVRRLIAIKDSLSQEIILNYHAPQCSSAGCVCPCTFNYTLFISSIDPATP